VYIYVKIADWQKDCDSTFVNASTMQKRDKEFRMVRCRMILLTASLWLLATAAFAQVGRVEGTVQLPNHAGAAMAVLCAFGAWAQNPPSPPPRWEEFLTRADSLQTLEQLDSAIVLAQQALEIAERMYGPEDTTLAIALNRLGNFYFGAGKYAEALPPMRRALAICEKALGDKHVYVAYTLNSLACIAEEQGRYADAEQSYRRALAICEETLGPDHPQTVSFMLNLAGLYGRQSRYADEEVYCRRVLEIRESSPGPDSLGVANALNELGNCYNAQGRFVESEPLFRRALDICEEKSQGYSTRAAHILNNWASIHLYTGRYAEAEQRYERSCAILEKVLGAEHPYYAGVLSNLAAVYCFQGRLADAKRLWTTSLHIREKALGPEHPFVAVILEALADLRQEEGQDAEAEALFKRALRIKETVLGPSNPDVALSLANMLKFYTVTHRYEEAEKVMSRLLEIDGQVRGPEHPQFARDLYHKAGLLQAQGRDDDAEPLLHRALAIQEKVLGRQHPFVAASLERLARSASRRGDYAAARDYESRAWTIVRGNFRDGVAVMAERNALETSRSLIASTANYLSLLLGAPGGAGTEANRIAEVVFSGKGQVSDAIAVRNQASISNADSGARRLEDSLRWTRYALSKLYVEGPGEDSLSIQAYRFQLDSVIVRKERLETRLARMRASSARGRELSEVDAPQIAAGLPPGAVLIEFMRYDHHTGVGDRGPEPRYLAVVLDSGGSPQVFPLGPAAAMDAAVLRYRQQFRDPRNLDDAAYTQAAERLYALVWRPFAHWLSGATTVFIAPDGDLNLVSFAGLVDDEGKYLIEDYPIHYLSTGRDLIRLQEERGPGSGMLAMGDPDFDMSYGPGTASAVGLALLTSLNLRSSCDALDKLNVVPLPGTRKEVESVAAQWRRSGAAAVTYFGQNATEEEFKRSAPGKRVIHLATHGFYISDECQQQLSMRGGLGMEGSAYVGENPLLLSGFLLAGANRRGKGADEAGREDGIVTAEEVAGLNLQGTDLVVLSACETGLGTVKSGEGVYGLRRAFQMAGARTVISALRPIDDKSTAEFMGQLFSARNQDLPHVMQRIAFSHLAFLRSQHKSDHPFYWAAFVATGDWKTL
jgi:CHAT domain-containing protein/Tfp pilus assembly protein PilF